ncbi:hypothetical protein NDU88_001135 [Pleurodeles waltl]|uniref:Uncharacterized protein n=1 Tax=Pleurodeles waltl TaxID=8319 RepID=A0AAV7LWS3_PLEWA|nr:hypothetical protein NDU88_001135 [Pleurodeles waltl]
MVIDSITGINLTFIVDDNDFNDDSVIDDASDRDGAFRLADFRVQETGAGTLVEQAQSPRRCSRQQGTDILASGVV